MTDKQRAQRILRNEAIKNWFLVAVFSAPMALFSYVQVAPVIEAAQANIVQMQAK